MTGCTSDILRSICMLLIVAFSGYGNVSGAMISTERHMRPRPLKKEVPTLKLKDLAPPFLEYAYFEGHDLRPFEPGAATFSLVNAWWLAEASTLAYADEDFAARRFKAAGLDEVRFFDRRSTQCYVASNRQVAVVAFRGSEVWKRRGRPDEPVAVADFMTNVNVWLTDWTNGSKVHRGFKSALEAVWDDLFPYLKTLQDRGCRIWMTGHSLGAALATLAADRYGEVQGVYTFGSPRVGDSRFKENYSIPTYRFVNGSDIVTGLPPAGFYVHVGEPKFIDPEGRILDRPVATGPVLTASQGERGEKVAAGNGGPPKAPDFVPDAVIDHVPVLYAIMIWNRLVDVRSDAE
jgi:hypothetical protein